MKRLSAKARVEAFTLIEVFAVIVIVFVIAAAILPTGGPRKSRNATQMACMYNQKEIALGFTIWENDNNGRFPWQTSITNSGTMELITNGHAASQFQSISNHLGHTSVFICPTDKARQAPTDYQTMSNQNISYFVNVDASTNTANTILTGDRHLQANGNPVKPGLFVFTNGMVMGWTRELHDQSANAPIGVMAFVDGHAQIIRPRNSALTDVFQHQPNSTSRLIVP